MAPNHPPPLRLADIDWTSWQPVERGTLLFVVRPTELLLIHKLRGLGAGKINGPGGRLRQDETPLEGAVREVEEEVGITPLEVSYSGRLLFQFLDGYSIQVWVYRAEDFRGSPRPSREAIPFWAPLDAIPYQLMWPDDEIWLPWMLRRRRFLGRFIFDSDRMLEHRVVAAPAPANGSTGSIPDSERPST